MIKENIFTFSKQDLQQKLNEINQQNFRNKQIWQWLYQKNIFEFDKMTNLPKETREKLQNTFDITLPQITKDIVASDETRKWLVKFDEKSEIEMVFIPEEKRGTLCISSQVGCTLACKFCHTGTQTLVRNLEFHEIIAQVLLAKKLVEENQSKLGFANKITNIVFMGMGEPFFNYQNVKSSIEILTDIDGLNFSRDKITVSTSGLVPEILQASQELKVLLAISLHATNDNLRSDIMAINKKYPLDTLLKACKTYNKENPSQKITLEYVMLKDINDQETHAKELISLINKYNINAKVNLIPFNKWFGCGYENSNIQVIKKFQNILKNSKIIATIRKTRGQDAMSACGQLKSESVRLRAKDRNL